MALYVDNMRAKFGRMIMCHMFADTLEELMLAADFLQIDRKWFQCPPKASWCHFDIALSKRALAVEAGAVEVPWRDIPAYADRQAIEPSYAKWHEVLGWEANRRANIKKAMEGDG